MKTEKFKSVTLQKMKAGHPFKMSGKHLIILKTCASGVSGDWIPEDVSFKKQNTPKPRKRHTLKSPDPTRNLEGKVKTLRKAVCEIHTDKLEY